MTATATATVTTRKLSQLTSTGWIQTTKRVVSYRFASTGSMSGEDSVDPDVDERSDSTGAVSIVSLSNDPDTSRVLALDSRLAPVSE